MNICTIVCRNYVAQARVLARSFAEHYPDSTCVALIVDASDVGDYADEPFLAVAPDVLGIDDFPIMAGIYDAIELSTAVKPWLLAWMIDRYGDAGPIAYFDPDIRIASPLVELEALLEERWAVLTPHLTETQPLDDEMPSEQAILLSGTYNLGFIALRRSAQLAPFLAWWQERLARLCRVDPANGFFVDQRFIDFVPGLFDGVGILRHPGYNVAYWNLATRAVACAPAGVTVDGLPLRFFHFSGFDPRRPTEISKHQTRVAMAASPDLTEIFGAYAQDLIAAGFLDTCGIEYGFARSAHGHALTGAVRAVYRVAVEEGFDGSLLDDAGDRAFEALLRGDEPQAGRLPRGIAYLWQATDELQDLFPDHLYGDRAALLEWCARQEASAGLLGGYLDLAADGQGRGARRRAVGVNVVGYLNAESGVGEAARGVVSLLDHAEVPVWPVALEAPGAPNAHPFRVPGGHPDLPFRSTLVCVNADMLPHLAPGMARCGLTETHVTGLWWWETERFPDRFTPAFAWVDRVIAGTTFVRDAIRSADRVPVESFPLPVRVGPVADRMPAQVPWPDGFVFLYSFDYASVYRRKNPDGLARAYMDAFDVRDGAKLVLKSINGDRDPLHRAALEQLVADREDIVLVDGFLSEAERNRLTASCDCYVSLHRSEGFGLTMAEAMYLGKPVIATAYSGNMDFMNESNALLVDYDRVPIGEDAGPYGPDGEWAEPDLADAARQLRRVFEDAGLAESLAAAAARSIRETHSPERGAEVLARILTGSRDD